MTAETKQALRIRMRAERLAFAAGFGAPVPVPAALQDRLEPGLVVAGYLPMPGEADPTLLTQAAMAAGCTIALPHIRARRAPMRFLRWAPGDRLVTGPMKLRQPADTAPDVIPDIVLTPLVAFDRFGNRLGQGAGFYDRAFEQHPLALRIGIAWSIQQVDRLPTEPWDVALHAVITEQGWHMIEELT